VPFLVDAGHLERAPEQRRAGGVLVAGGEQQLAAPELAARPDARALALVLAQHRARGAVAHRAG
jgi:hypothetical protein